MSLTRITNGDISAAWLFLLLGFWFQRFPKVIPLFDGFFLGGRGQATSPTMKATDTNFSTVIHDGMYIKKESGAVFIHRKLPS